MLKQVCIYACCTMLAVIVSITVRAQKGKNNFIIEGTVKEMTIPPEKVYLDFDTILHRPVDSAVVSNGKYSFKGRIEEPCRITIRRYFYDGQGRRMQATTTDDQALLFLDKGTVNIVSTGMMSKVAVTSSPADLDYRRANKRLENWADTLRKMYKLALETKNDVLVQSILSPQNVNKLEVLMKEEYPAFIHKNPASGANLFLIRSLVQLKPVAGWIDSVAALYRLLPAIAKSGPQGQIIGLKLESELKTALGHTVPDFTQNDTAGRPVSLSSFKGKYVLLDFWASWDDNSSRALPVLAKAYENFGSKGLVILGVSLDTDKNSWLQMIRETNIGPTKQVSDLKGRQNTAALLYGITDVPRNLLIDPNGIVVARNLTAVTLDKTLSSIFE